MGYIATIDCGSSNVRCIVFDMETGRQVSLAARDWYVPQNSELEGAYDFEGEKNWDLVCQCTRQAMEKVDRSQILAVTASGFRHALFGIDPQSGEVVYGCFNMDSRIDVSRLHQQGLVQEVFDRTGDFPSLHGLSRLLWLQNHDPSIYRRIGKIMMVSDWVVYKLCGEIAMEPGDASSTLLLDVRTRRWAGDLLDKWGISREICPQVVDAGTPVGRIGSRAAQETGLPEGTVVVCGVADTQAGLTGVGAGSVGSSVIVGGTWWMNCYITDKPVLDPNRRTRLSCHSERDRWIYEGVGFQIGLIVRWFRDVFGTQEKWVAQTYGMDAYDLLDRMTLEVPAGSYGMQVLLSNVADQSCWRMCAPTFMGWDILDPKKSHKGVFFKAILENACYNAYGEFENIRRILEAEEVPQELILSGGAAHSPVWSQILSDVMGKPVHTPVEKEGTAIGAAIYAAVGMGLYGNTQEAMETLIHRERTFEPNMENHSRYLEEYARWRELYQNGLSLVERGLVKSMWQQESTVTETQKKNPWKL